MDYCSAEAAIKYCGFFARIDRECFFWIVLQASTSLRLKPTTIASLKTLSSIAIFKILYSE